MRSIHIENNIWKYVIKRDYYFTHVNLYDPNKKMIRLTASKILGTSDFYDRKYIQIKPSDVKKYILENLSGKEK